ncbi:MAG: phosphoribosylglycinamide formyltransferase [Myxococcales bacterium]|nr:phosphoribosylglycinamide formyltransferase [Myxococcales bacterium]
MRVAILLSGRGSNAQALLDDCAAGGHAQVVRVISNRPGALGLKRAEAAGVPAAVVDHRAFPDRAAFEAALHGALTACGAELVCLAGFMRLLTAPFVEAWHDRLINIHPSLLPAFPGLDTHARALAEGVRFHGCTVHFVRAAMDAGPIIGQAAVPVHPSDDADSLAERVLAAEHRLYPWAVRAIAAGRVTVRDERAVIEGWGPPAGPWLNPAQ